MKHVQIRSIAAAAGAFFALAALFPLEASAYEVPVQIPHTLVDQVGYRVDGEKTVILRGEDIVDSFSLRDAGSGETVWSGSLYQSGYTDSATGEKGRYASFNDFRTPGQYVIFNDTLGESFSFRIDEDPYAALFEDSCKVFYRNRCGLTLTEALAGEDAHSACHVDAATLQSDPSVTMDVSGGWHLNAAADRDVAVGCSIVEELLLAYELSPEAFSDETRIPESGNGIPDILDEVRYEIEWLLRMQEERSGGVYGSAVTRGLRVHATDAELLSARVEVTSVSENASIAFAAALARFGYDYRQVDADFARTCLRAADRAFRYYETGTASQRKQQGVMAAPERFLAAALLYRATGGGSYRSVMEEYFQQENFADSFMEEEALFHGGIVYLDTRQSQDTAVCNMLMQALIRGAEQIAEESRMSAWLVCSDKDTGTLLRRAVQLRVADHVIYNYEYTTIIEDHIHYLLGRNPQAMNLVTTDTEWTYRDVAGTTGVLTDPVSAARFISLISVTRR
ncbi:MAG: glycoside hydrolase family 9 protein [Butyrivibrio sp.]|nr:glycoside hydrolase family 9 protein [Butyrivibrio sp.]